MQLHDDEEIVWQTRSNDMVLTSFRFRYTVKGVTRKVQSVMLEQILLCSYVRTHRPILLFMSAVLTLASYYQRYPHKDLAMAVFFLGLLFAAFYAVSIKMQIVIHTSTIAIEIPVSFHNSAFAEELIDAIEQASIESTNRKQEPQTATWHFGMNTPA